MLLDRAGRFKTYYDETLNTSGLVFNDSNEIVITFMTRLDGNSYLVPRPGVRLNLADLIENLPSGARLDLVQAINNRGDILGFGITGNSFLLKRIRSESDEQEASAASGTAQPAPQLSAAAKESLRLRPTLRAAFGATATRKQL